MHQLRVLLLASSLMFPGAAMAAPDQAPSTSTLPSEHRLSPQQIETVLTDAARRRELVEPTEDKLPPAIHGEIGFAIGTGGYRSAFGTAVVPLPGDGVAILSLGTDRFGPSQFGPGRGGYYQER